MTTRIAVHVLAGLASIAAFSALPAVAEDAAVGSKPAAVAGDEKLTHALSRLSAADGFEIRGLDRVGDETVHAPKTGSTVQVLRRMLTGYAYTVELAPADPAAKAPRKLVRVSILGRSNGVAGDAAQPSVASAQSPQIEGASNSVGGSAGSGVASPTAMPPDGATPTHPVVRMMHDLAQASIPVVPPPADGPAQSGAASQAANGQGANGPTLDPVNNPADMATLTRTATANLNALVQSLKAACPAGAKC